MMVTRPAPLSPAPTTRSALSVSQLAASEWAADITATIQDVSAVVVEQERAGRESQQARLALAQLSESRRWADAAQDTLERVKTTQMLQRGLQAPPLAIQAPPLPFRPQPRVPSPPRRLPAFAPTPPRSVPRPPRVSHTTQHAITHHTSRHSALADTQQAVERILNSSTHEQSNYEQYQAIIAEPFQPVYSQTGQFHVGRSAGTSREEQKNTDRTPTGRPIHHAAALQSQGDAERRASPPHLSGRQQEAHCKRQFGLTEHRSAQRRIEELTPEFIERHWLLPGDVGTAVAKQGQRSDINAELRVSGEQRKLVGGEAEIEEAWRAAEHEYILRQQWEQQYLVRQQQQMGQITDCRAPQLQTKEPAPAAASGSQPLSTLLQPAGTVLKAASPPAWASPQAQDGAAAADWIDELLQNKDGPVSPNGRHHQVCEYIDSFLQEVSPSKQSAQQPHSVTAKDESLAESQASRVAAARVAAESQAACAVEAAFAATTGVIMQSGSAEQQGAVTEGESPAAGETSRLIDCTVKKGSHGLGIALDTDGFRVVAFNVMPEGVDNPGELAKPKILIGDFIVAVGGVPCATAEELAEQIGKCVEEVVLTMERTEDVYKQVTGNSAVLSLSRGVMSISYWLKHESEGTHTQSDLLKNMNKVLFDMEQKLLGGNLGKKERKALKKEIKLFDNHIQEFRRRTDHEEEPEIDMSNKDVKHPAVKKSKSCAEENSQRVTRAGVLLLMQPTDGNEARVCLRVTAKGLNHFGGECAPNESSWHTAIRHFCDQTGIAIPKDVLAAPCCGKVIIGTQPQSQVCQIYIVVIRESSLDRISPSQWQVVNISHFARKDQRIHPCFQFSSPESISTIEMLCRKHGEIPK